MERVERRSSTLFRVAYYNTRAVQGRRSTVGLRSPKPPITVRIRATLPDIVQTSITTNLMMNTVQDFSEENIRKDCPHCDSTSFVFKYPLEDVEKSEDFYLLCDPHSIVEGHLLVIPKEHLAGVGELSDALLERFKPVHEKMRSFVLSQYGSVAVFEHGKFGQTVFHSHIHYLPFTGQPEEIIPEGKDRLRPLEKLEGLREVYRKEGGYLFFMIGEKMYTVDPALSAPRFFRDRFANALHVPERGDWKAMHEDTLIMGSVHQACQDAQTRWKSYFNK